MPPESGRSVETRLSLLERRQAEIWGSLNGATGLKWEHTVRGRLHNVEGRLGHLEMAATNERRKTRERVQRLDTWVQVVLAVCALGALATPYILHFAG